MSTAKKGGGSKMIKSRTKQENDDRLIMAMQWVWRDDYEQQYKDQFGIDDEWSKRIYFDRAPLTAKDLREYPDPLRPPPWVDSGAGKPKRVALNVCGVEAAFRGGYITAEDLLKSRENVVDHTTKMRLLKEAALLKNLAANKGKKSPNPASDAEEEEAKEVEDDWWPNVEVGVYTFHEKLGPKDPRSAVTAKEEIGKLTVEGCVREVSKSAKRMIANKIVREEQQRIEQAKIDRDRRKKERRNALLHVETQEDVVGEDGTTRPKSMSNGVSPESGEGGADGKFLGQSPKASQTPKPGQAPMSLEERKKVDEKLDDDFAHAFDDWNSGEDGSKSPLQKRPVTQGERLSPKEKKDANEKTRTKKGKKESVVGSPLMRRKSLQEPETEDAASARPRRKSQQTADVDAESGGGKRRRKKGSGGKDKETASSSPNHTRSADSDVVGTPESEHKERSKRRRRRKKDSGVEGDEDFAERSIFSAESPGESTEEGDGSDDSDDFETDSEESNSQKNEEEEPNLSWWGWAKDDESPFRRDHCAIVDQMIEFQTHREAFQKMKEVYKVENKQKNKASFKKIEGIFAAAEASAEDFLRAKLDRYGLLADDSKVKHARTKSFHQLADELEKSVWNQEATEELVKHNTGVVGDKVVISEEHKNNASMFEFVNKVGVLVRRDTDIEGWWADFTTHDGKTRRRQNQAKKKPAPQQSTAEKLKMMRAKIKSKQERAQSAEVEGREARPERLFCTGHNGRFWLAFVGRHKTELTEEEQKELESRRAVSSSKPEATSGARERARRKRHEIMIAERVRQIRERGGLMTRPKSPDGAKSPLGKSGAMGSRLSSALGTVRVLKGGRAQRRSMDVSSIAMKAPASASSEEGAQPPTGPGGDSNVQFASVPSSANSAQLSQPPSPLLPPIARKSLVQSKLILDQDDDENDEPDEGSKMNANMHV